MKLTDQQVIAARVYGRMTGDYAEEALATEVLESRAEIERLKDLADKFMWQVRDTCARAEKSEARVAELEALLDVDRLEEIITDSIDLDWTPRTAAKAIVRAMGGTRHDNG